MRGGGPGALAWLALCGFAIASAFCLAVLWPRPWELAAESGSLFATGVVSRPGGLRQAMVLKLREVSASNRHAAERLRLLLQLASIALALDVLLWMVAIAVG
jgi:hypothetical protein